MAIDLEDYEAAFVRVERQLQLQRDWGRTETRIRLLHTLNAEQIDWFRAGSALNVLKTQAI